MIHKDLVKDTKTLKDSKDSNSVLEKEKYVFFRNYSLIFGFYHLFVYSLKEKRMLLIWRPDPFLKSIGTKKIREH